MKLKMGSIICLCLNIIMLIPLFLGQLGVIYGPLYPPLNYYFALILTYGLFLSIVAVLFALTLFIINMYWLLRNNEKNLVFYIVLTILFLVDIALNVVCLDYAMMAVRQ